MGPYLGEFEQLVLLAIVRLGPDASGAVAEATLPGDRKRKIFALAQEGEAALAQAYGTWARMTRGLKPRLESM